ncbi:MAG: peptidase E [Armatimonadetes bacterium]|nr:peptidase E [Armatimonadota bacterium]MBS1702193.1 peptidase E [Armatimonadota bacterium]
MRHIVAMGGGGFSMEPDNLALDRYVLSLVEADKPKVCFIPTASADSEDYTRRFYEAFEGLGCEASHLSLFWPHRLDFDDFMMAQDVIYVGGGNTRNLLLLWKDWGLDSAIRKAYENGTVLAGISAGANCWFEEFSTDSMGPLAPWKGLGWLNGSFCPHYDGESDRRPSLKRMLDEGEMGPGFACDDGVAAHYIDENLYQFVSSRPSAMAYRVEVGEETPIQPKVLV